MHYLKPASLALTASLLSTGVCAAPFSYNELSVYYSQAIAGVDGLDSELKLNALDVDFSKELENQFFLFLGVGKGVIDQVITERNLRFDVSSATTIVSAGIGKYFVHDNKLNSYLAVGIIHSQMDLDIDATNTETDAHAEFSDSETDTDLGAIAGLRLMLSEIYKLELKPALHYSAGDGDSSTSVNANLRWYASEKLSLDAGYGRSWEGDTDSFSLGVSFILD